MYSASTTDTTSSALDFSQGFGGLNKRSSISKTQMITGGIVLLGIVYLVTKGK